MIRNRLQARAAHRQQGKSARAVQVPLPLAGVYARSRSAQIRNLYAAEMHNLRSDGLALLTRPGASWITGPSQIIRRIPFEFAGISRYIAVTATKATSGPDSITRDFGPNVSWSTNSGFVVIADGNGLPVKYNGSDFSTAAFTAAAGPDPATCDGILSHHDRIYLWKTGGDLDFLVGDVGAISGAMSRFDLGVLGNITGSLHSMVSLTVDAGQGMNDVLCIVTTTGQLVIYEGLDPTDPQDWRLTARIEGAAPLGPRAFCQVGPDAWMLTRKGPVSILQALRTSTLALVSDLSRPISEDIAALVDADTEGVAEWQMVMARDGSMVVINRYLDGASQQFIYYTESQAWATADFQARDWHNIGSKPHFTATDGRLGRLIRTGTNEAITARWVSSWFTLGGPVALKWVQPIIRASGPLAVRIVVLSDNNDTPNDITEAEQTITLQPEEANAGGLVTLSDIIPTDAFGDRFQITLEVTARWMEITGMSAGIGS